MENEAVWQSCLKTIEETVGTQVFELWFKPIKVMQIKEQQATIELPNRFYREWIEEHYPNIIPDVITGILKRQIAVKYKVAEKQGAGTRRVEAQMEGRKARLASRGIYLNPKYTFENFIIGPSNQFAGAAAKAVTNALGKTYNPLFIYGGVGLGKTHLLNAIGNHTIDRSPDIKLIYIPAEQFTNEFVYAMRNDKMGAFKEKYRNADILLIDDIQFIAGKTGTQEELFYTFNALYESQKQIVISSDRPPKEITPLTDRLKSRFTWGLIADMQPPDVETKLAILWEKAKMEGITLADDVAHYLASRIRSNIREMEGCLIRLGAHASLTGQKINLDMAKEILKDIIQEDEELITIEKIQKVVCEYYGIKVQELKARNRSREIAVPRQVAMYLSKQMTDTSLSEIGKSFGGKDHSTVIHSCKQVEAKKTTNEEFNRRIETLIRKIKS